MAEVTELLDKLKKEAEDERDMFSGSKPRQFFIELMESDSIDKLLEEYDPKDHDTKWAKEYQKVNPDIDELMKNGRAIDFMSAGKLGVIRHYMENELDAHVRGMARINWNVNILKQTKEFMTLDYAKAK